jgi:hypothetical protein
LVDRDLLVLALAAVTEALDEARLGIEPDTL